MKTILIGLGNPILGDDGVGWKVAEEISKFKIRNSNFEVDYLSVGGLGLMERLVGYERAILVDAVQTGQSAVGSVRRFRLEELPDRLAGHLASAHDTSLQNAIELGRDMGARLPEQVFVVGIEAQRVYDFSEELSAPVAAAIPQAARLVLEILQADEAST